MINKQAFRGILVKYIKFELLVVALAAVPVALKRLRRKLDYS